MAVYLDNNATTPMDERVVAAMVPYLRDHFGNASSVHGRGRLARQAVETAREQVAQLVKAHPSQVIFTSGGTEANNLALNLPGGAGLALSRVEHASVTEPARRWQRLGHPVEWIEVDEQGRVNPASLEMALAKRPRLVSIMLANNETGVIQDIPALSAQALKAGAMFHTDAVQAVGKIDVDFGALGVQMLSLSAHKIYGPKGAGALVVDPVVEIEPLLLGGGQERGRRSGTENVAAIVGFGAAAELAMSEQRLRNSQLVALRDYLEAALASLTEVVVFAQEAARLPNTVFMAIPGIEGEALLMALDRAGVEVSSGSACDSRKSSVSHVLQAMGVADDLARCAIRVSLGKENSKEDIDRLMVVLKQQIEFLHSASSLAWA